MLTKKAGWQNYRLEIVFPLSFLKFHALTIRKDSLQVKKFWGIRHDNVKTSGQGQTQVLKLRVKNPTSTDIKTGGPRSHKV